MAVTRSISLPIHAAVELALGSYPGFHVTAPPGKGAPYGVFEAAYVPAAEIQHTAVLPDGTRVPVGRAARELLDVLEAPAPAGAPEDELTEALRTALADRRAVLLLDDAADAEQVDAMITEGKTAPDVVGALLSRPRKAETG